jgi:hypothetical protein
VVQNCSTGTAVVARYKSTGFQVENERWSSKKSTSFQVENERWSSTKSTGFQVENVTTGFASGKIDVPLLLVVLYE